MRVIKWDIAALLVFTAAAALAYLFWYAAGYDRWVCYLSAPAIVAGLAIYLRWCWVRLRLWLTRFFCIAAMFDLLMEGFVHPFHPETLWAKLTCQLSLFAVYAVYLAVLRPLDLRLATRRG
jgi:hypothetical protein